jgi:hypothetical protein
MRQVNAGMAKVLATTSRQYKSNAGLIGTRSQHSSNPTAMRNIDAPTMYA